jgi:hypothetical protein
VKEKYVPIVVQNRYFIRAGVEAEGLATRRSASAVRAVAGQPAGRVLLPAEPTEDGLTFIWECEYPDLEARNADAAWADGSAEFGAVRAHMGTLLDRFERIVFVVDDEPLGD